MIWPEVFYHMNATSNHAKRYGLVTEECPTAAVGCRIKAQKDHVEWYEWSKLYDRNQLVCVYPGEYDGTAGCQRKPSGNVRCWCGGTSDCNDEETSSQLVDAFQKSDRQRIQFIIARLEEGKKVPPTTTEATTTRSRPTRPTAARRPVHRKLTTRTTTKAPTTSTTSTTTSTTTTTTTEAIDNDVEDREHQAEETLLGKSFDETRRKLNEEMREEDERLQQLLADEEAELSRDQEDSTEGREEQRRRERERNRMERRERARADERRRQTEEQSLRNRERAQKFRKTPESDEDDDEEDVADKTKSSISSTWSLSLLLSTVLLVLLRSEY
ncbi:hypothetical protein Q1695_009469 [Nippostrongylus brasiliensis]|nr:hypothetical protein Q1695_009469 [Nippostrongylus brasiliensis]